MASLRAKGLGILVVPTIGLFVIAAMVTLVERRERETDDVVKHAASVRRATQRALLLLLDAETGVRGYVATGDGAFLEPYERAKRELPDAFTALEQLHQDPADDPAELKRLADRHLAELAELQRVRADPVARLDAARRGKATMDRVRAVVASISEGHARIESREEDARDRLDDAALLVSVAAIAVGLLGGVGVNALFFSRVIGRVRRVQTSARRLASGQSVTDDVGGNDELADLAASLREAANIITAERARLDLALDMGRITIFEIDEELRLRDQRGEPLLGDGSLASALAAIDPADRDVAVAALEQVRKGGEMQDFTLRIVGADDDDGDNGWMAGRIARLVLADGSTSVLGVSMDITEVRRAQEALRESERRLATEQLRRSQEEGRHNALLLASAGEGIYSVDAAGVCTSINPAGARMLGYEVAELVGVDMHDTIHHTRADGTPYPPNQCPVLRSISTGDGLRDDTETYWRRDGTRLAVEFSSFPLVDEGVVRGAVVTFTDATDRQQTRVELEEAASELRRAIAAGELVLHYQPKVELDSGTCEAVEALVRWQRSDRLVFPDEFVPQAERSGAIDDLTGWVVEEAVRQMSAWRHAGLQLRVAVNLSALSLQDDSMTDRIATAAAAAGLPASCIEVEVTESMLVDDTEMVLLNLAHFRAMGVRSAIDDFGTGFSSLSYLKHLPVTYIKIDKSFVMNMPRDPRDQAIVATAILLAHSLGLRVVAEGVEDETVMGFLRDLDCDVGQGYHWTKPLPAAALERWLSDRS